MAHAWFDTPLGPFGIAWSKGGLTRFTFAPGPESLPGEAAPPPPKVRRAIAEVGEHLGGNPRAFDAVALDLSAASELERRVYEAARRIPSGKATTYGELAKSLGNPGLSRAVGGALGRNPLMLIVPCHRVLAANGRPGGFSATGGLDTKRRLLELEGFWPMPSLFAEPSGASRKNAEEDAQGALALGPALAVDEAGLRATLAKADPELGALMDRVGPLGLRPNPRHSPYETLIRAIIGQQISGAAARSILEKVVRAFEGLPSPEVLRDATDARLRECGVSRGKALSLRDLAARASAGEIPTLAALKKLGDEPIIETLSQVRGIGRWTVQMMLIFHLGRPDVLPVTDLGIQKGFGRVFLKGRLATPEQIVARAERWRPYRSVASWYLWRATELP